MTGALGIPQLRLFALLVFVSACATVAAQWWIGDATIYSDELMEKRALRHEHILANTPPAESWDAAGARGTNIRIGAVYVAEVTRQALGTSIHTTYKLLDSIYLFVTSIALVLYLRRWLPPTYCVIGMLYFWLLVTITYQNHSFHPWDRPSTLAWLVLLYAVHANRLILLFIALPIAVAFKHDAIFVPALYFLAHVRRDSFLRVTAISAALTVAAFGTYFLLLSTFPGDTVGGGGIDRIVRLIRQNLEVLAWMGPAWPPLLFHGAVTLLALAGIFRRERFQQASMVYGAVFLMVPWFLMSRFEEVRAHWPYFLLLLPPALMTLREWLEPEAATAPGQRAPALQPEKEANA